MYTCTKAPPCIRLVAVKPTPACSSCLHMLLCQSGCIAQTCAQQFVHARAVVGPCVKLWRSQRPYIWAEEVLVSTPGWLCWLHRARLVHLRSLVAHGMQTLHAIVL